MWNFPHLGLVSPPGNEFVWQATIIILTMILNCPPCSFISVLNLFVTFFTFTVQSIVDHGVLFTYTGQEVSIYQNKSNWSKLFVSLLYTSCTNHWAIALITRINISKLIYVPLVYHTAVQYCVTVCWISFILDLKFISCVFHTFCVIVRTHPLLTE